MNQNDLDAVLDKHYKWLNSEKGGEKADLSYKNLRGLSFRNRELSLVDLRCSDLRKADLSCAHMFYTELDGANLEEAYITEQQLSIASYDENTLLPEHIVQFESCSP